MKKPVLPSFLRNTAIILLFLVSLNALAAGYSFIREPSGRGLGISTDYLKSSAPFRDYLIPGIILFVMIGVLSSLIAITIMLNKKGYSVLLMIQGFVFIVWIAIQLTMVKSFHPLHLIIACIGVVLFVIGYIMQRRTRLTE